MARRLDHEERWARRAFRNQRKRAAARGIAFAFDYPGWRAWWDETGEWPRRGRGRDKVCMGRLGDAGPYEPTNVYLTLFSDNARFSRPQLRLDL